MLVCYARYVVGTEWQQMEDGTLGDQLNPWGVAMFQTIKTVTPDTVAVFRPEFRVAFDAWLATDPFNDPTAPSTPFAMDEYQLAAATEAERLGAEAEINSARARASIDRAGNYVLGVVLFAVALFFGGMRAKVFHPTTKRVMVWIGIIVFVIAFVRVATYPVRLTG
jgi:hypothetical protein